MITKLDKTEYVYMGSNDLMFMCCGHNYRVFGLKLGRIKDNVFGVGQVDLLMLDFTERYLE